MAINLDFEAARAFSKAGSPPYRHERGKIREVGTSTERVRPLEIRPTLFLDFVQLDLSPDSFVEFASRWGLLTVGPDDTSRAEPVEDWKTEIREMRTWIRLLQHASVPRGQSWSALPATVTLGIRLGGDLPALVFRPRRLKDALWLQLAQFVAGGGSVLTCSECGKDFGVGAKKRADAKFCSDRCRFQHHNKRRRTK